MTFNSSGSNDVHSVKLLTRRHLQGIFFPSVSSALSRESDSWASFDFIKPRMTSGKNRITDDGKIASYPQEPDSSAGCVESRDESDPRLGLCYQSQCNLEHVTSLRWALVSP